MISTVFIPKLCLKLNEKKVIESKHVAASVLNDCGNTINVLDIKAVKKVYKKNTTITEFGNGAANCWSVVDPLIPCCKKITKILDWFHIRQAYDKSDELFARIQGSAYIFKV